MKAKILSFSKYDAFFGDKEKLGGIGEFTPSDTHFPGGFRGGLFVPVHPKTAPFYLEVYHFHAVKVHWIKEGEDAPQL